jgi:hypothetical protein
VGSVGWLVVVVRVVLCLSLGFCSLLRDCFPKLLLALCLARVCLQDSDGICVDAKEFGQTQREKQLWKAVTEEAAKAKA